MGTLLDDNDKAEIRTAIKLVTDQFFVTPLTYRLAIESVDPFNEDRGDMLYTELALLALVEYEPSKMPVDVDGSLNKETVKATINLADLIATYPANVDVTTKKTNFNKTKDYILIDGLTYRIDDILYDGPLDRQNVLLIFMGHVVPNKA